MIWSDCEFVIGYLGYNFSSVGHDKLLRPTPKQTSVTVWAVSVTGLRSEIVGPPDKQWNRIEATGFTTRLKCVCFHWKSIDLPMDGIQIQNLIIQSRRKSTPQVINQDITDPRNKLTKHPWKGEPNGYKPQWCKQPSKEMASMHARQGIEVQIGPYVHVYPTLSISKYLCYFLK